MSYKLQTETGLTVKLDKIDGDKILIIINIELWSQRVLRIALTEAQTLELSQALYDIVDLDEIKNKKIESPWD